MDDPFRLRVLKALTETIKAISPANGYQSDLSDFVDDAGRPSSRVFRGRDSFGFSDPRPMVAILEHPRSVDQLLGTDGTPVNKGAWPLLIQGFADDDQENPTDPAHILAADVIKALAKARMDTKNLLGFGSKRPCVTKLEFDSPVVRPPELDISDVAFFFLTVTLTLVEDLENPFS